MIRKLLKNLLGNDFTESNERYAKINFTIIFLMFIISAIMLLFLPEQLPIIHEGAKTYNVPSILGVWLFPVLALVINLSFIKQKKTFTYKFNCIWYYRHNNDCFLYQRTLIFGG